MQPSERLDPLWKSADLSPSNAGTIALALASAMIVILDEQHERLQKLESGEQLAHLQADLLVRIERVTALYRRKLGSAEPWLTLRHRRDCARVQARVQDAADTAECDCGAVPEIG